MRVDPGWDLLAFATQLRGVGADNVRFGTVPIVDPALPTPDSGVAIEVAPDQVRSFFGAFTTGKPTTTGSPATDYNSHTLPPGDVPCVN